MSLHELQRGREDLLPVVQFNRGRGQSGEAGESCREPPLRRPSAFLLDRRHVQPARRFGQGPQQVGLAVATPS